MTGIGCDGTRVYIGLSDDGYERAVKRLHKDVCGNLGLHEKNILNTLNAVNSKYIVRYWFYDENSDEEFAYLILDLCEETLEQYVASQTLEDLTKDAPGIMRQILEGLNDLHRKPEPILHRDLKPSNIMRDVHGKWLMADFGLSRTLCDGQTTHRSKQRGTTSWRAVESYPTEIDKSGKNTESNNDSTKSDDQNMTSDNESTKSGTAKSDNNGKNADLESRYKKQSDIQVAGMVGFYILTKGAHPFGPEARRLQNLLDDKPVLASLTDPMAKDLITWMLQHNPEDRPYASEALKHPFLQSSDQQFELLERVGNEQEIKKADSKSDVVNKINNDDLLPTRDWQSKIHPEVLRYVSDRRGKCSKRSKISYGNEWSECLRFIRNTSVHWNHNTPPTAVQNVVGKPQEYFLKVFPTLPVVVHRVIRRQDWKERPELAKFF